MSVAQTGSLHPRLTKPYCMIVFDAGGTLIGADWERFSSDMAEVATEHGLEVDHREVMRGLQESWREVIHGRIPDQAHSPEAVAGFWHHLFARALCSAAELPLPNSGQEADPRAVASAEAIYPRWDDGPYHRTINGARKTLRELSEADQRLGLLSNWSPNLPRVLQRLNLDGFFEFVIVSSLVGVAKPDRAIFDIAVARSGCKPENLLYVGDSPAADIAGSRAAGWDAALVAHRDPARHGAIETPYMVQNLPELLDLLGLRPDHAAGPPG